MKTIGYLFTISGLLLMASCSSNHRMVTQIYPDGQISREVYAYGDSAFMAGDNTHSPFLFSIRGWQQIPLDASIPFVILGEKSNSLGKEDKLNVKVKRTWNIWENPLLLTPEKKWLDPLAVPQEKLEKHFRWFYTYYTFTCSYRQIEEKGPIPIEQFLNKQEQRLLFQGDLTDYQGMSGLELNDKLNDLTERFMKWYDESLYELRFETIEEWESKSGNKVFISKLKADKDAIKRAAMDKAKDTDLESIDMGELLDTFYQTTYFSTAYKKDKDQINLLFEEKCQPIELFGHQIKYELNMPGRLITANTSLREGDAPYWKVDAYRMLPGDYILEAQSRVPNIWAFVITGFLALFAICGMLYARRQR